RAPVTCGASSHPSILEPLSKVFKGSVIFREPSATRAKVAQTSQTSWSRPPPNAGGTDIQTEDASGVQAAAGDAPHDALEPLLYTRFTDPRALLKGCGSRDFEDVPNIKHLHQQTTTEESTRSHLRLPAEASAKSTVSNLTSPSPGEHNHDHNGSSD
ncbi:hypothetical protein Vafri_958, partial [Volvox africanus]